MCSVSLEPMRAMDVSQRGLAMIHPTGEGDVVAPLLLVRPPPLAFVMLEDSRSAFDEYYLTLRVS